MNEILEYFEEENLKSQPYYHGTTNLFKILEIKPPVETKIIREAFRKNNRNVVYVTSSLGSAQRYAQKAVIKFGGDPVVYRVEPDWDSLVNRIDCEYITNFAKILGSVD